MLSCQCLSPSGCCLVLSPRGRCCIDAVLSTHTYIEPRAEQRKLVSDTSVTTLNTHPILIMSVFVREWVLFSFVPTWALLHRCSAIDADVHRGAEERPAGNGIIRLTTKLNLFVDLKVMPSQLAIVY